MINYSHIIKDAWHITLRYKALWLFGLFVVGGANVNFFRLGDLRHAAGAWTVPSLLQFLQAHPGALALASIGVLAVSAVGLVLTNWSRIMLVLCVDEILKRRMLVIAEQLPKSRAVLRPVISMSLLTSGLMVVAGAALLLPPFFWIKNPDNQALVWVLGIVLLLMVAFTVSCINIFTSFYIVLFRHPLGKALNLGTDLFVNKWMQVLGLTLVLGIIYGVGFTAGTGLIYIIKTVALAAAEWLARGGMGAFAPAARILSVMTGLALWLFAAGLSVFFNTALLLLFFQFIAPEKFEEKERSVLLASEPAR